MRLILAISLLLCLPLPASTFYVRSTDGSDADSGATWALAKASLEGAFTAAAAGDTIYVSQVHAESKSSANMALASPGTAASPCRVLCGNDVAEPPTALATTATISTTTDKIMTFSGYGYCYGIAFNCDTGGSSSAAQINFNSTSPWWWKFDSCILKLNSSGNATLVVGAASTGIDDNLLELYNTPVSFALAGQKISVLVPFRWTNTASAIAGTVPTTLFVCSGGNAGVTRIRNVDLSAAGSGKNLIDLSPATTGEYELLDCKLNASVNLTTGTHPGFGGTSVKVVNCDSSVNTRYAKTDYRGTVSQETTIVRTGGASDGAASFSRKFVSSANTKFFAPLEGPWFRYWNTATGSPITVAVEVVTDNVTLTDAEAWVECEYQGTSGNPIGSQTTDRAGDILASPANQTTSTETWTTTGLTTPVKQTLSVAVTPQKAGWIRARVALAKASTTLYACPKILSTSASQFMTSPDGDIVNSPASGGSGGETSSASAQ